MADAEGKQKAEEGKQKAEEGKQKAEEGKQKLISSVPYEDLRQWQTFILAFIIIVAYVVFFAWIISTSPETLDKLGKKVIDYSGMTSLTGTFGIIAAAVVGYYFGQRNLKQAADIAQNATEIAKEAKDDAKTKKIDLNNERKNMVNEINKGIPIYEKVNKFISDVADDKSIKVEDVKALQNVNTLKKDIEERIADLKQKSNIKKKQIEVMETPEDG